MARPFLQPETRRTLNEHDSKWHIKAILRLVATFFAFIAMILFAVSISISLKYFDLINGDWTDGLPLAPVSPHNHRHPAPPSSSHLANHPNDLKSSPINANSIEKVMLSLLYNPAILLLTIYHRHGKPVHPGWNVAIDLIIWALCVPAVVLSVGEGWFWSWIPVQQQIDGFIPCDDIFNFFSEYCNPEIYTAGKTEIAGNVFLALLL